jgi:hypothetical protein
MTITSNFHFLFYFSLSFSIYTPLLIFAGVLGTVLVQLVAGHASAIATALHPNHAPHSSNIIVPCTQYYTVTAGLTFSAQYVAIPAPKSTADSIHIHTPHHVKFSNLSSNMTAVPGVGETDFPEPAPLKGLGLHCATPYSNSDGAPTRVLFYPYCTSDDSIHLAFVLPLLHRRWQHSLGLCFTPTAPEIFAPHLLYFPLLHQ